MHIISVNLLFLLSYFLSERRLAPPLQLLFELAALFLVLLIAAHREEACLLLTCQLLTLLTNLGSERFVLGHGSAELRRLRGCARWDLLVPALTRRHMQPVR